jgi:proton-translocating NADH-quinone oxidoreductase chain L
MPLISTFTPFLTSILLLTAGFLVRTEWLGRFVVLILFSVLLGNLYFFPHFVQGYSFVATLGSWTTSGLFDVNWTFFTDSLTYTMTITVLTVSLLVHLYSLDYMKTDAHLARFISYLSLFTFFMLVLISGDSLVTLFLGWEGVGLCSYLLISFWYTRIQAGKAAIKAMIVNRVTDLFFTVGILTIFYLFQTVEFSSLFGLARYYVNVTLIVGGFELPALSIATLLLFLGAMGKSAQIGFHTWLPDAMEGPTPVSALIHAATMVTSGIFLLVRTSPLFEATPAVLQFVTLIGASTAFMAATAGLVQNDLKKIIAYSTCSQLGYMAFIAGLSGYSTSFFHLTNHAFFKALLFLSAGAVIHAISNEQDLRRLGGLTRILPYTYGMFMIGSLALMGFPFLTGFYSKDLILETTGAIITIPGLFAYNLGLVTAFFTAFYSFRLLYLAFYSSSRSPRSYLRYAHELTPGMALVLATLALGSIFFGYFARDLFVGLGTPFWNGAIYCALETSGSQTAGEFLPTIVKVLPFIGSVIAVTLVFTVNSLWRNSNITNPLATTSLRNTHRFLSHKWYFDTVYNRLINQPLLTWAYNISFKALDKGIIELFGPTGFGKLTFTAAKRTVSVQTGRLYTYALFMLLGLLFFSYVGNF